LIEKQIKRLFKENETVLLFVSLILLSALLFYSFSRLDSHKLFDYILGIGLSLYTCLILYVWLTLGKSFGFIASILSFVFILISVVISHDSIIFFSLIPVIAATAFGEWFYKKEARLRQEGEIKIEKIEGDKNDLEKECKGKAKLHEALQERTKKFITLSEIAQTFSSTLNRQEISSFMVEKTMSLIGKGENCSLYLVDREINRLRLAIIKSNNRDISKEKYLGKDGDIYDHWAVRQKQVLLIEDTRKDFRFREEDSISVGWQVSSLVSSPLIRGEQILGLLRLDSPRPLTFTANDLRFLDIISNIGAAALENARLLERTEELGKRDGLTNLYVHRYFLEELARQLQEALRSSSALSLLMIDIDNFKSYNDLYGHTVGDLVLKRLARILLIVSGVDAIVSRYGGEEFAVILPRLKKEQALVRAEEIRKRVMQEAVYIRKVETHISVSIGVKTFPQDAMLPEGLIKKSDDALRMAKAQGKNRTCS
jgi:diguanylate cyclase (GGDEF)-like protein